MQQPNINSRINGTLNTANNEKNNITKMKSPKNSSYQQQVAEVKKNGLNMAFQPQEFSVIQQNKYQHGYGNFNKDQVNEEEDDDDDGPPGLEDSDDGQKSHDGITDDKQQKQIKKMSNEKETIIKGQREKENSGGQKDDSVMTGRSGNFGKIEQTNANSFNNKGISRQSYTTPLSSSSSSGSSGSEIDDRDDSDLSVNDMIRKTKEKSATMNKAETYSSATPKVQYKYGQTAKLSSQDNLQRSKESFVGVVGNINTKTDRQSRLFEGKEVTMSQKDLRGNGTTRKNYQNTSNEMIKQNNLRQSEQMGELQRQKDNNNDNRITSQYITTNLPNLSRISLIETPKLKNGTSTHSGSHKSYIGSDDENEEIAQQSPKKQYKSDKDNEITTESIRQKENSYNSCQIRDRRGRVDTGSQYGNQENMMETNNSKHKSHQSLMKEEEGESIKQNALQQTKQLLSASYSGQQQSNNQKNQLPHVSSKSPITHDGTISQRSNTVEIITSKKSSNHDNTTAQGNSRETSQRTSGDSGQKHLSHTKASYINGFSLEESQQNTPSVSQPDNQSQEIFSYIEKINESIKISNEQMELVPKLIKAQKALEIEIQELQQNLLKFHKETKVHEEKQNQQQEENLNEMGVNRCDCRKLRGKVEVHMKGILSAKKETLRFMRENLKMIEEQNKQCKICSSMGSTLVDFHHIIQVELGKLKETTKQTQQQSEIIHKDNKKNSNDMGNPNQIEDHTDNTQWNNKTINSNPSIEALQQQLQEARAIIARLQNEVVISDEYVSRLKSDADEAKEVIRNHLRDIASQKQSLEQQQRNLDVKEREIIARQRELDQQLLIHQISQNNSPIKQIQEQQYSSQSKKSSQQQFSPNLNQVSPYSQLKSSGSIQFKVSEFFDDSQNYLPNISNINPHQDTYSPALSKRQNLNNMNDKDLDKNNGTFETTQRIGYGYSQAQTQQFFRNEEEINDLQYLNNKKMNGKVISQQILSPYSTKDSNKKSMQFSSKTSEIDQQSDQQNGAIEAMKTLIRSIQEQHSSVIDDINSFKK